MIPSRFLLRSHDGTEVKASGVLSTDEKKNINRAERKVNAKEQAQATRVQTVQGARQVNIIEVPLSDIQPYETNPRQIGDDAIDAVAQSIKLFGWQQPIVIDSTNKIVAGHVRYMAALKMGLESIPVKIADSLSDQEIKSYRLLDNKVAELSKWDSTLLDFELSGITSSLDDFFEQSDTEGSRAYAFLDDVQTNYDTMTKYGGEKESQESNKSGNDDVVEENEYATLSFSVTKKDRDFAMTVLRAYAQEVGVVNVNQALMVFLKSKSK